MKKSLIIGLITIGVVVITSVIVFVILIINRFKNIDIISEEKFKDVIADMNLEAKDITEEYKDVELYNLVDSVLYVEKENCYKIQFITFKTDMDALNFYSNSYNYIESNIRNSNMKNYYNIGNYRKYNVTTDTDYYSIIRVKNTVLNINGQKEYKKELKNIIKKLNY